MAKSYHQKLFAGISSDEEESNSRLKKLDDGWLSVDHSKDDKESPVAKLPLNSFKYRKPSPPRFSNGHSAANGHSTSPQVKSDNDSPLKTSKFSRKAKRLRINSSSGSDSDEDKKEKKKADESHKAVSARDRIKELRETHKEKGEILDLVSEGSDDDEVVELKRKTTEKRKANGDTSGPSKNVFSTEKLEEVEKLKKSKRQPSEDDDSDSDNEVNGGSKKQDIQIRCLSFFNDATEEEISGVPRATKFVKEIVNQRPYNNYKQLRWKFSTNKISLVVLDKFEESLEIRDGLDKLLNRCNVYAKKLEKDVRQLISSSTTSKLIQQPTSLNHSLSLKPYQLIGMNWLMLMHENDLNAILADEMGLGKTIQVIAFLALLKERHIPGPHVIVVPSSTLDNWLKELELWCPKLRTISYYGSLDDRRYIRRDLLKDPKCFDCILTTYSTVGSTADDRQFFKRIKLTYAVFDEAHMLKNCTTARYISLMSIAAKRKLLLTGTPLQNDLVELVSLLYFVMPTLFDKYTEDMKEIFTLFKGGTGKGKRCDYQQEKIEQAKTMLKPLVLRRLKSDVLSQLPPKKEQIERCPMTDLQAKVYKSVLVDCKKKVKDVPKGAQVDIAELEEESLEKKLERVGSPQRKKKTKTDVKAPSFGPSSLLMQLRKAANHPLLLRYQYDEAKLRKMSKLMLKDEDHRDCNPQLIFEDMCVMSDFELHRLCVRYPAIYSFHLDSDLVLQSGKFVVLDKILKEKKEQKEKVLLFSQFVIVLDIIEEYMNVRKHKFVRLDGSTPVIERQALIERFQSEPDLFIFLLSTKAGGLGINLTAASNIILHDLDFNPYNDKQAEDRCHRMGQSKEVTVIKLISSGTVEESIMTCAEGKLKLERKVTDTTSDDTAADVESLLKQALNM